MKAIVTVADKLMSDKEYAVGSLEECERFAEGRNERIRELAAKAGIWKPTHDHKTWVRGEYIASPGELEKFAELIVKEMCGLMEQAEDDVYHCFDPSERPTEYIEWLRDWQERFTKHFGVEE